jgi:hypothetical protein
VLLLRFLYITYSIDGYQEDDWKNYFELEYDFHVKNDGNYYLVHKNLFWAKNIVSYIFGAPSILPYADIYADCYIIESLDPREGRSHNRVEPYVRKHRGK